MSLFFLTKIYQMQQVPEISKLNGVENKGFEILAVGESSEVSKAISALAYKNKDIVVDLLKVEGEDFALDAENLAPEIRAFHNAYTDDLVTYYDLIVLQYADTALVRTILKDASDAGVMVSTLNAPAPSANTAAVNTHQKEAVAARNKEENYWRKIANRCLFALAFILLGHVVSSYYPLHNFAGDFRIFVQNLDLDAAFGWMVLAGFVAQMVDGALGMGYGVISTTVLLSTGLNPAAISGSIHTAEMFSSGASGYSHYRFGNINKKLFKALVLPGVLGAVIGATLLAYLGEEYGEWLRPVLSLYTLLLGLRILVNAFKKRRESQKVKNAGWLAGAGGFLDSFGGGGWGPLVTSTLISKGKTPRYIIGTVSLTEFFVTFGSALTFFIILGTSHIETIAGLIIGGLLAAPLAARLAGKLKTKTMLISVGVLVIISSVRTMWKTISALY